MADDIKAEPTGMHREAAVIWAMVFLTICRSVSLEQDPGRRRDLMDRVSFFISVFLFGHIGVEGKVGNGLA